MRPQSHNGVRQRGRRARTADLKNGPSPCLLESYGRQAEDFGPQGGGRANPFERRQCFLKERSWNVIENKGPVWKTRQRSGNVYENKVT
jgi:hypothetical protein